MSLETRKPTILSMAEKFLSKEFFNKLLLGVIFLAIQLVNIPYSHNFVLLQTLWSSNKTDKLFKCKQWLDMDDEAKSNASFQCRRLRLTQANQCKTLFVS